MSTAISRPTSAFTSGLGLLGWVLLCFAAALPGMWYHPDAWYAGLEKPSWNPPNWVFGPVWSVLYLCMGVSAWRMWRMGGFARERSALGLFLTQLALNALWTPVFFGQHRADLAMIVIIVLLVVIAMTRQAFRRQDAAAAWLLVPYLFWVAFAAALNVALWRLN